jgi:hypothetical protein
MEIADYRRTALGILAAVEVVAVMDLEIEKANFVTPIAVPGRPGVSEADLRAIAEDVGRKTMAAISAETSKAWAAHLQLEFSLVEELARHRLETRADTLRWLASECDEIDAHAQHDDD